MLFGKHMGVGINYRLFIFFQITHVINGLVSYLQFTEEPSMRRNLVVRLA